MDSPDYEDLNAYLLYIDLLVDALAITFWLIGTAFFGIESDLFLILIHTSIDVLAELFRILAKINRDNK